MSGINLLYNDNELVLEKESIKNGTNYKISADGKGISSSSSFITNYSYKFKRSYRVGNLVKNSPAYNAGILKGDIIKKINNKNVNNYKLNEIMHLFQSKPDKKIKIELERLGFIYKYEFILKKRI